MSMLAVSSRRLFRRAGGRMGMRENWVADLCLFEAVQVSVCLKCSLFLRYCCLNWKLCGWFQQVWSLASQNDVQPAGFAHGNR